MNLISVVIALQILQIGCCISFNFNDTALFQEVFQYLNKYNGMNVDHVLIVSTEVLFQNEESSFHAILNTEFIHLKSVSYVLNNHQMANVRNEIIRSKSTLIIVLDDNLVSSIDTFFEDIPEDSFVENTWLLISSQNSKQNTTDFSTTVIRFMKNSNKFQINSHVYFIFSYMEFNKILFEAYKFCHDRKPVIKPLMLFPSNGLMRHRKDFIWNRRKNLRKCRIRVAYVNTYEIHEASEATKYPTSNNIVLKLYDKTFYGMKRPIFGSMIGILNFSIDWIKAEDNAFGSYDPKTGNWNGAIRLLAEDHADMSVNWFFVTSLRAKYITFTVPFQTVHYKLFMKKSRPSTRWGTFTNVLSFEYLKMMLLLIFLSVVSYILYLSSLYNNVPYASSKRSRLPTQIKISIVTMCYALVGFDTKILDNRSDTFSVTKRLLQLTICFFGIINFYVYNGGLISSLMVQKYESPEFEELTDFLHKPIYRLLIDNNIAVESYLSTSSDPEYKRLWNMVKHKNGLIRKPNQGERNIMADSNNILLSSSPFFEYSSKQFPCNIVATRHSYGQERVAFAFNNKSVYIELFNYHIKRILETGVKLFQYSEKRQTHCERDEERAFRPMTFSDIFSAFVIVGIGCALAVVRSLIEFELNNKLLISLFARASYKTKKILYILKIK